MINIRRSAERGRTKLHWLESYHTFSFGEYLDPRHMGFRSLRVLNEDFVEPGQGFDTHPHKDAEIFTYVLEGALAHRDSLGHGSVLHSDEVQMMTAGKGIAHSEYNYSRRKPVHFLQVWIAPKKGGLDPSYAQRVFRLEHFPGEWVLLAGPEEQERSLLIHQDVRIWATALAVSQEIPYRLEAGRFAWIQVAKGAVKLNQDRLSAGDGAAIAQEPEILVKGQEPSEILLFDLA